VNAPCCLCRGLGLIALQKGLDLADGSAVARAASSLDLAQVEDLGVALRSEVAGQAASRVAVHPAVRAALLSAQRRFAESPPGGEIDGPCEWHGSRVGRCICWARSIGNGRIQSVVYMYMQACFDLSDVCLISQRRWLYP
jgi:hypothetical protein